MDVINLKPFDPEMELKNERHEQFIQSYLRLDEEYPAMQSKKKRVMAYKEAYPDCESKQILALATRMIRNDKVAERLAYLSKNMESDLERKLKWTEKKAEDVWLSIIANAEKDSDRINAVDRLNKLRGIGKEEEKNDDITLNIINTFGKIEEE